MLFQSTRPSRASTTILCNPFDFCCISIHKALAGLDTPKVPGVGRKIISIHKALAGLDASVMTISHLGGLFQSTRPSRASTTDR